MKLFIGTIFLLIMSINKMTPKLLSLVQALKVKDPTIRNNAFNELFEVFYDKTFKAAYFITKDNHLAQDATQEAFIQVLRKIDQLRDDSSFGAWLATMATNFSKDLLRKNKHLIPVDDFQSFNYSSHEPSLDDQIHGKEVYNLIMQSIYSLEPHYREVLILKFYCELSDEEISKQLEIPLGTTKSRIHRAKKILQEQLSSLNLEIACSSDKDKEGRR